MKQPIRAMRNPLEIGAFAAGKALVPLLPRSAVLRLARTLGALVCRLDARSRNIARANLRTVLPEICGAGREDAVIRDAFSTFALTYMDLFWFSRHAAERLRRYVLFDDSCGAYIERSPVIAVCAHYGNWETLGQAMALAGAPAVSVAAPLRSPTLNRWMLRLRTRTGQQIISREGAARGLMRTLRDGKRIALLLDQNTRVSDGGVWVPFFGLPVLVSGLVELLARRMAVPAVTVYNEPRPDGTYRAFAGQVLSGKDMDGPEGAMTAAIMHELETRIRTCPGNWLWMYRRWKYIAPDVPAERYPFYAHKPS